VPSLNMGIYLVPIPGHTEQLIARHLASSLVKDWVFDARRFQRLRQELEDATRHRIIALHPNPELYPCNLGPNDNSAP
jgi:hypothetical protein